VQHKLASRFSDDPGYQVTLGIALLNLSQLLLDRGQRGEADSLARQALAIHAKVADDCPQAPECLNNRAVCLIGLGRVWKLSVKHQPAALRSEPRNGLYRQYLRNHYGTLAETLLTLSEYREAARAAAKMPDAFADGWRSSCLAAGLLARCVSAAEKDDRLSPD